jgi:hypothetical protein
MKTINNTDILHLETRCITRLGKPLPFTFTRNLLKNLNKHLHSLTSSESRTPAITDLLNGPTSNLDTTINSIKQSLGAFGPIIGSWIENDENS